MKQTKGRQTRDGAEVRRVQVTLDDATIERARVLGDGNLSQGIRWAVASLPNETEKDERGMMPAKKEPTMNASHTAPASPDNLKVAYHPGGLMFAGDERYFPAGWYLFDGEDARPVTVFEPFSNDQIVVGE